MKKQTHMAHKYPITYPKCSMYGIFTCIDCNLGPKPNVGTSNSSIHGAFGYRVETMSQLISCRSFLNQHQPEEHFFTNINLRHETRKTRPIPWNLACGYLGFPIKKRPYNDSNTTGHYNPITIKTPTNIHCFSLVTWNICSLFFLTFCIGVDPCCRRASNSIQLPSSRTSPAPSNAT